MKQPWWNKTRDEKIAVLLIKVTTGDYWQKAGGEILVVCDVVDRKKINNIEKKGFLNGNECNQQGQSKRLSGFSNMPSG